MIFSRDRGGRRDGRGAKEKLGKLNYKNVTKWNIYDKFKLYAKAFV